MTASRFPFVAKLTPLQSASIVVDIAAHLPHDVISGVVYIDPMPYIGDITPRIATPAALQGVVNLQRDDDVMLCLSTRVDWVDLCFSQAHRTPYELKSLWMGSSLAATPADLALMINRSQNLEPFTQGTAEGRWPILLLQGDADALIKTEEAVREVEAMWKNVRVVVLEGAGHASFCEDTEGVMKAIAEFTSQVHSAQ